MGSNKNDPSAGLKSPQNSVFNTMMDDIKKPKPTGGGSLDASSSKTVQTQNHGVTINGLKVGAPVPNDINVTKGGGINLETTTQSKSEDDNQTNNGSAVNAAGAGASNP